MGVTISHTNLLIYRAFSAKINDVKTNKEYIVSNRLTRFVSKKSHPSKMFSFHKICSIILVAVCFSLKGYVPVSIAFTK